MGDKEFSMYEVMKLRELETEHEDKHAFKNIAWVIGVVVILAIIVFWFRKSHDERCAEHRYDGANRGEYGEQRCAVRLLEKQVEKLEEKQYFTFGKLEKLYGETKCYEKFNTHEVEELEVRCYPRSYIGGEEIYERRGRGGCGERHGHCGKKFVRTDTYTPDTQQVIVTEDCNCG